MNLPISTRTLHKRRDPSQQALIEDSDWVHDRYEEQRYDRRAPPQDDRYASRGAAP